MKSQNDMIISAVAIVLVLIFGLVLFFTRFEPVQPAPPEPVKTDTANFQPGAVTFADKLPGASNNSGGGEAGGGRAPMAGGGAPAGPQRAGVSPGGGGGGGAPPGPSTAGVSAGGGGG